MIVAHRPALLLESQKNQLRMRIEQPWGGAIRSLQYVQCAEDGGLRLADMLCGIQCGY